MDSLCNLAITTVSIENNRSVSLNIKFIRRGLEKCLSARLAERINMFVPSLINLIFKDTDLLFYLSCRFLVKTRKK